MLAERLPRVYGRGSMKTETFLASTFRGNATLCEKRPPRRLK